MGVADLLSDNVWGCNQNLLLPVPPCVLHLANMSQQRQHRTAGCPTWVAVQATLMYAFRRGTVPAAVQSLAFSPSASGPFLAALSAHGTLHLFVMEAVRCFSVSGTVTVTVTVCSHSLCFRHLKVCMSQGGSNQHCWWI